MVKRRKRRINLGLLPKEHRTKAHKFYQYAVDAHQRAKESSLCSDALANLCGAMRWADLAVDNLIRSNDSR
jgi:hypothetical protein